MAENRKETEVFLRALNQDGHEMPLFYRKELIGNIDFLKFSRSRERKEMYLMSREFSTLDLYILFAVNNLRICDLYTIERGLKVLKNANPSLSFSVEEAGIVKSHISRLVQGGFLMGIQYVINSDVSMSEAYEKMQAVMAEEFFQDEKPAALKESAADVDDLEEDGERIFYQFDFEAFQKEFQDRVEGRRRSMTAANETFRMDKFRKYYGKEAKLVKLYCLDDYAHGILASVFGRSASDPIGFKQVKGEHEILGLAACGNVAGYLMQLSGFVKFRRGVIKSKNIGNFKVPVEMQFESALKDGSIYRYYCAVFHAYNYDDPSKFLKGMVKERAYETIQKIRNYIGIMGLTRADQDAVVVVVVNNGEDLIRFVDYSLKAQMTEAEYNRLFFTSDSVIRTGIGTDYMARVTLKPEAEAGYDIDLVRFPVI